MRGGEPPTTYPLAERGSPPGSVLFIMGKRPFGQRRKVVEADVPESLDELVGARLTALPEGARSALALVAALGAAPIDLLAAAGHTEDALEPALVGHVVERVVGEIRFTHPLLASGLYRGLARRRQRHH